MPPAHVPRPVVLYPRAYFAAPVHFALKLAAVTAAPLAHTLTAYTGLYTEVTGVDWRDEQTSPVWRQVLTAIATSTDPQVIADTMYTIYLQQPHSRFDPTHVPPGMVAFGPLALDYLPYNAARRTIRIHFLARRAQPSWLASARGDELTAQFRRFLQYAKRQHPDARWFKTSSWLNNIPNYRRLFPPPFTATLQNIGAGSYWGVWGQFVQADGRGNEARLQQFVARLAQAHSLDEAVDALPLKVLEGIGPIDDFYQHYQVA